MKSFSIIAKNFKLLLRAKSSAFIVLIGPLIVVLLVGLVFSSKSSYELSIGYFAPEKNNLTESFISKLKTSNYYVHEYRTEQECTEKIEQGVIHTCIIFPEEFEISNKKEQYLRFMVDYSRISLVYKVIDSVSGLLELESKELSYSLTSMLLDRVNLALKETTADLALLDSLSQKNTNALLELQKAKTNTALLVLEISNISTAELEKRINDTNSTLVNITLKGVEMINKSQELLDELTAYLGENETADLREEFDELSSELSELYNFTPSLMSRFDSTLKRLSSSLREAESLMAKNKDINKDTQARLDSLKATLSNMQEEVGELRTSLLRTKQELSSLPITAPETIVSPVNIRIEPVAAEDSKVLFSFPFLLVVVIMFVALLLSSSLLIIEKSSKARFRVCITPTRQSLFVFTTFLTSLIVLIIQTSVLLIMAEYFLGVPILKNASVSLLIILAAIIFFIVIGMLIGYLFSTQEGAIMSSIILGCVLLFLSNLVFPLETISPNLAIIIRYNPYVLASELLRKALLFNITLTGDTLRIILILTTASLLVFFFILIMASLKGRRRMKPVSQGMSNHGKIKRLETEPLNRVGFESNKAQDTSTFSLRAKNEFVIYDKKAANKEELFRLVSDMTKTEFEDVVNERENKIAEWLEKEMGEKKLASKIRKARSRKDILVLLAEDIKKSRINPEFNPEEK